MIVWLAVLGVDLTNASVDNIIIAFVAASAAVIGTDIVIVRFLTESYRTVAAGRLEEIQALKARESDHLESLDRAAHSEADLRQRIGVLEQQPKTEQIYARLEQVGTVLESLVAALEKSAADAAAERSEMIRQMHAQTVILTELATRNKTKRSTDQ